MNLLYFSLKYELHSISYISRKYYHLEHELIATHVRMFKNICLL